MSSRYEIRLSGSGGQGLVLAGLILAEASGIYEGKHVVQTVSYGPAGRGPRLLHVLADDRDPDFVLGMLDRFDHIDPVGDAPIGTGVKGVGNHDFVDHDIAERGVRCARVVHHVGEGSAGHRVAAVVVALRDREPVDDPRPVVAILAPPGQRPRPVPGPVPR